MSKLIDAMGLVNQLHKTHAIAQRGGKKYTQVVHRMEAFRTIFGTSCGVDSEVILDDGQRVVVKCVITDENGRVIGSGMAEEIRGQGNVNKTSALENCETSAIGRALASLGLAGGEYASANELDAVERKSTAIQHSQATAPLSTPKDDVKTAESPPSPAVEQSPEPVDEYYEMDKVFHRDIAIKLQNFRGVGKVHDLFKKSEPALREIKGRNPERAEHLVALFHKHEARIIGESNG